MCFLEWINRIINIKKARDKTKPTDSAEQVRFFIASPMIWSAHIETYLEDKAIPYLKRGRRGAALMVELGASQEIYDYYVPTIAFEEASKGLEELKRLVDYEQD